MTVEVQATLAGLIRLENRFQDTMRDIVDDALKRFGEVAIDKAPEGEGQEENPTSAPAGFLKASFVQEGPAGADGVYTGRVGPTAVFARQRELGGPIYPGQRARAVGSVQHPLGTGHEAGMGKLVFRWQGIWRSFSEVHQVGSFYMKRTYDDPFLSAEIATMVRSRLAETVQTP